MIDRFWPTMDRAFVPRYGELAHYRFYALLAEGFDDRAAAECLLSVGDHAPEQA